VKFFLNGLGLSLRCLKIFVEQFFHGRKKVVNQVDNDEEKCIFGKPESRIMENKN
jgi:hypothetical protein